jgi:hypothetical protein
MPSHIQTQTLEYEDRREDLRILAQSIDLIAKGQPARAAELLIQLHAALLMSQQPKLKPYNPGEFVQ